MPAAAGGPACAGRNPLPTKLFGWRTSHHETDTSLLSPRHPPGCPGTAGKVFGPVPGRPSPGGANPGNRGLHWTDGQSLSRLQLPANPPDGDLIRPTGHRLYLSHLWYVSLPEFCDRARGRALCRPDPGRSAPGKSFLSGPEPIWRRLGAAVCLSEKEFSQRAGQTLPGSGAHPGGEWLLPAGRQSLCLRPAGGSRTHHAA